MKNSISIRSAIISGFIGTTIGLAITYFYNWGQPVNQLTDVFIAIGTASFCASFGGNIGGQMEILDRTNNN
jgi:ABC-type dipeptide/oligopeptide/nickel transport system permease subunit